MAPSGGNSFAVMEYSSFKSHANSSTVIRLKVKRSGCTVDVVSGVESHVRQQH